MSTISITKLEKFLMQHEMVPSMFYTNNKGKCVFLEVFTANNDSFLVYISSKYNLIVSPDENKIITIEKHKINNSGDILDNYCPESSINTIEDTYEEVSIVKHLGKDKQSLDQKYKKLITLTKKDNEIIKSMFRQTRRLNLCMQGLMYTLCMINDDYIFYNKDESSSTGLYSIEKNDVYKNKNRRLLTVVSLETLYKTVKNTSENVKEIRKNIHEVILKNLDKHSDFIYSFVKDIKTYEKSIKNKLEEYKDRLTNIESTLSVMMEREDKLYEDKIEKEQKIRLSTRHGLNRDLEIAKGTRETEEKLLDIRNTKKELVRNIISLKSKYDNVLLSSDDTLFDISVLSDTISCRLKKIKFNI